ncbi:hypothetical protein BTN49_1143 [Candidatus Enterovibrio escicola]|uniref:Uncharacterized protein n=1 Tax=Candidatus Enterovibrio escicola TaxID=1927127 RepID=A0A2A5T4P7_9GAMM|nr:hypothetical protein BTN49_1143 [Candidatus Enterovibrio escacola]
MAIDNHCLLSVSLELCEMLKQGLNLGFYSLSLTTITAVSLVLSVY